MKQKVLFICVHNSARSQMAEAFLKEICGDYFEAHSAGLEPGRLNPLAVEAIREIGIDISQNQTHSVFDVFKSGALFAYVITVCDESSAERCPVVAGVTKRLHWSFPDPAALSGAREERLAGTRKIRDQIRARIEMWCDEMCPVEAGAEDSITTLDRHKRRPAMSPRAIYCRRSQSFASLSNLATKQAACERKQTFYGFAKQNSRGNNR